MLNLFLMLWMANQVNKTKKTSLNYQLEITMPYYPEPPYFLMFAGFLATFPIDILGTLVGAKWGNATKWGLLGASIGALVGLFFGLPGIIVGPIVGAFVAELIFKKRTLKESATAGAGAGMGLLISTAGKALLALLLIFVLVIDIFFIS